MIGVGFVILSAGILLFALGVLAAMRHPTGGDDAAGEMMRDGGVAAAIGVLILIVGWLF